MPGGRESGSLAPGRGKWKADLNPPPTIFTSPNKS